MKPFQTLLLLLPLLPGAALAGEAAAAPEAAVQDPARPAADVQRDAARKPAEVLAFLGIEPGMRVLEVFAGGGYYTQILNGVVDPDGEVLAHNNAAYMGFVGPQFEARFADGGLPNVTRITAEANDIELEAKSLDAAVLILAYHDFFFGSDEWGWPDVDEQAFLTGLCDAMKPGAILGVVDHIANAGADATSVAFDLHRVDPERVKSDMAAACFDLAGSSDLLRNPADDHATSATEGPMQGQTDRFVYKFVRR
jgi:predicted methyltransferase